MSTPIKIITVVGMIFIPWFTELMFPGTFMLGIIPALILHVINLSLNRNRKWLGIAILLALTTFGSPAPKGRILVGFSEIFLYSISRMVCVAILTWMVVSFLPTLIATLLGEELTENKLNLKGKLKSAGSSLKGNFNNKSNNPYPRTSFKPSYKTDRSRITNIGNMTVYGKPGSSIANAGNRFGINASVGACGEALVGNKLINNFSRVPGSALFNGVKFKPNGSGQADVDHALVLGNTVYLVDAKYYKSGTYRELPGGKIQGIFDNGKTFTYNNKMNTANSLWKSSVPYGTRVSPKSFVAIEGGQKRIERIKNSPIFIGTTEEVVNEIRKDYSRHGSNTTNSDKLKQFVKQNML